MRRFFAYLGGAFLLAFQAFRLAIRPPYHVSLLVAQIHAMGVLSLVLTLVAGLFAGMVVALQGLPVGLQTVLQVMQQSPYQGMADRIPLRVQLLGQVTSALERPAKRRLRIPARHGFHQFLQGCRQSRRQCSRPLPSRARTSHAGRRQRPFLSQLRQSATNRIARQAGRAGDHRYSTPPEGSGLRTGPQSPVTLVHRRQERAVFRSDLPFSSHAASIGQADRIVNLFLYER